MTAVPPRPRPVSAAVLIGALLCATAACGSGASRGSAGGSTPTGPGWEEPASYTYTLTSRTQVLAGTFRVEVRDGAVAEVVGLDEDSRRAAREVPGQAPTIGGLLERLEQARGDDAHTAEAEYAADGHPVRISLDWDENAIDDEALYLISAYQPSPGRSGVR
ncbi:DUF6174 domain-containing protein [Streptomyces sp. NPDC014995]|uniref:DUF6174 domain-containing protein n=1 Tax=Streptomyces sp. NPDC014995 TaxID=3364936 RepID=UPI0036FAC9B9